RRARERRHELRARGLADAVPQDSDPLDLELDLVSWPKPAPVAVLEDAARPDGARPEDVAGHEARALGRVGDELLEGPVDVAEVSARALLAVDPGGHLEAKVAELVRSDQHRPERGREVLSLRRTEADGHLRALEVARRPVVQDREAGDPAFRPDDRGDLELVVPFR